VLKVHDETGLQTCLVLKVRDETGLQTCLVLMMRRVCKHAWC
jgi:hypothetical protein